MLAELVRTTGTSFLPSLPERRRPQTDAPVGFDSGSAQTHLMSATHQFWRFTPSSLLSNEGLFGQGLSAVQAQVAPIDDQVERARRDRLALLVKQFEGDANREDRARVEILTERLRRLAPKVSPEAHAVVERGVAALEASNQRIAALKLQYGID